LHLLGVIDRGRSLYFFNTAELAEADSLGGSTPHLTVATSVSTTPLVERLPIIMLEPAIDCFAITLTVAAKCRNEHAVFIAAALLTLNWHLWGLIRYAC
jgi:hypothetical protein